MKRQFFAILLLTLAFAMSGCGRNAGVVGPGRPVSAYIGEYVSKIEISHSAGGTESKWTAAGAEVDSLRSWANGLKYDILDVEEGHTPGDRDGGEVYSFALTEGEYPGFSYVIDGSDSYLLIEGHWYTVSNPSRPPCVEDQNVADNEKFVSFRCCTVHNLSQKVGALSTASTPSFSVLGRKMGQAQIWAKISQL